MNNLWVLVHFLVLNNPGLRIKENSHNYATEKKISNNKKLMIEQMYYVQKFMNRDQTY